MSFFLALLWRVKSGPGMQLTTAGMPPGQAVALGRLNSSGQAARCTSVPVHATECTRKWRFCRSRDSLGRGGVTHSVKVRSG